MACTRAMSKSYIREYTVYLISNSMKFTELNNKVRPFKTQLVVGFINGSVYLMKYTRVHKTLVSNYFFEGDIAICNYYYLVFTKLISHILACFKFN